MANYTVVVSVLSCTAPKVSCGKEGMSEVKYRLLVYNRIVGMLKSSAFFRYRNLVLGAGDAVLTGMMRV